MIGADDRSPAYSPWLPALGCSEIASKPVISAEPALELLEQLLVAFRLVERRERMDGAELGQVIGIISVVAFSFMVQEPSGIIAVERQVLVLQTAQVAQHLGLAVVLVEHRMRQEAAWCAAAPGDGLAQIAIERVDFERSFRRTRAPARAVSTVLAPGLVERDAETVVVDHAQIDAARACGGERVSPGPARAA